MDVYLQDPVKDLMCNPYAQEFLTGNLNPGTPEGFEDLYTEYVYTVTLVPADQGGSVNNSEVRLRERLALDDDFIIRALRSKTSSSTGADDGTQWTARFRDVDGSYMSNARIMGTILAPSGAWQVPIPDWYIPKGMYVGIEIEHLGGGTHTIEIVFVGVIRKLAEGYEWDI